MCDPAKRGQGALSAPTLIMPKRLIFYIILITVILIAVFFSQQAYSRAFGKSAISAVANQAGAYVSKGSDWVISKIYPKIDQEVQKRGEAIQNEVNQQKEKITENSENIITKIGNYFSGISDSILHPGENNNCPKTPPTQTSN